MTVTVRRLDDFNTKTIGAKRVKYEGVRRKGQSVELERYICMENICMYIYVYIHIDVWIGGNKIGRNMYARVKERRAGKERKVQWEGAQLNLIWQGGGSGSGSQRYSSSYGGSSASTPYDDNKGSSSSAVYEDKRQSERASSYHRSEDRHSASRSYAPPPPPRISEMAPPTQRYTSSRGRISHQSSNYRGRISTRGSGRGGGFHRMSSRSDVVMARRRNLRYGRGIARKASFKPFDRGGERRKGRREGGSEWE